MEFLHQTHPPVASLPEEGGVAGVAGATRDHQNLSQELWEPLPVVPGVPGETNPRWRLLCRAVRALCDHTGAADGHLSFQKGDILQLLSTVDEDWIRCCHGNNTGLVPVGYTSLIL